MRTGYFAVGAALLCAGVVALGPRDLRADDQADRAEKAAARAEAAAARAEAAAKRAEEALTAQPAIGGVRAGPFQVTVVSAALGGSDNHLWTTVSLSIRNITKENVRTILTARISKPSVSTDMAANLPFNGTISGIGICPKTYEIKDCIKNSIDEFLVLVPGETATLNFSGEHIVNQTLADNNKDAKIFNVSMNLIVIDGNGQQQTIQLSVPNVPIKNTAQ